ncbi:MAG TPA: hypothetical protein VN903_15035 [Polyangia bacterium]|nr:hypothetical protein [Polyangia bacterium]HXU02278.1 hypothetical protein [Polyangia bacterium]
MDNEITATIHLRLSAEDLFALLARTMGRPILDPVAVEAATPRVTDAIAGAMVSVDVGQHRQAETVVTKVTPEAEPEPAPATVSTTPPPVPVTAAKSSRAARAAAPSPAKTEAKTEAPEPLSEFGLRSLLSKVGTVHPKQVKGVIDLLQTHGGHRRLSECPATTWPAIESAARAALDQYGAKTTRGTTGDAA